MSADWSRIVYALYSESKKVIALVAFSFLTELVAMSVSLAHGLPLITYDAICSTTSWPTALNLYG
jgi:hypothetical protein